MTMGILHIANSLPKGDQLMKLMQLGGTTLYPATGEYELRSHDTCFTWSMSHPKRSCRAWQSIAELQVVYLSTFRLDIGLLQSTAMQLYHHLSWSIMIYHGLSWFIMVYHDLSWFIMIYHGFCAIKVGWNGDQLETRPKPREFYGKPLGGFKGLHHGFHLFVVSLGGVAQPLVPRTVTAVDGAGTVDVGS